LDGVSARHKVITFTEQQNTEESGHIHASSGIPTHDPSVRAVEDCTYLTPRGNWDRRFRNIRFKLENIHFCITTLWC